MSVKYNTGGMIDGKIVEKLLGDSVVEDVSRKVLESGELATKEQVSALSTEVSNLSEDIGELSDTLADKMEFYKVNLQGTKNNYYFTHTDENGTVHRLTYNDLKSKYQDDKYFLFCEWRSVTFIPSLPPDYDPSYDSEVIEFSATWDYMNEHRITTIKINSNGEIKADEFSDDFLVADKNYVDESVVQIKEDLSELSEIMSGVSGSTFLTKNLTTNGEVGRYTSIPDEVYVFIIHKLANCKIAVYEYKTDGTYLNKGTYTSNVIFNTKATSNTSYFRVYASDISGDASVNVEIVRFKDVVGTLSNYLSTANVTLNKANLSSYGYTDVLQLPKNRAYKISGNVVSSDFRNLPVYSTAGTLVCIASDRQSGNTPFDMYLFITSSGLLYTGFGNGSSLTWRSTDTDYSNSIIKNSFDYVESISKTISANGELIKFYPVDDNTYNVYVTGDNCTIEIYEFKKNGSYNRLATKTSPFDFKYKRESADTDYLRVYAKPTESVSLSCVIIRSNKNIVDIANKDNGSSVDFAFSNEFCAVRKFTVIGDSLASGYYAETDGTQHDRNLDYSWVQILARMNGQVAINATKSGVTTKEWYTDTSHLCKAFVTANNKSQVYVIGIGTNDYKDITPTESQKGSVSDINFSNFENNADSFYGNYAKIIQYIHSVSPTAQIICLTIPTPRPETVWKEEAIRTICGLSQFSSFVSLCDLVKDYRSIIDNDVLSSHHWQNHFSPIGYSNSARFLNYALSKTMRENKEKFITLPQIQYDE